MLPLVERKFPTDPSGLLPSITMDNMPYWDGLSRGEFTVQQCRDCGWRRFPGMPVCPRCGSCAYDWTALAGKGTLFSWVRYQKLFLQEFADVFPYIVITAELDPGVRVVGRLLERDIEPTIGAPVWMKLEKWPNDRHVPVFSLTP
jgi:uncharacterized OB-fold protein